MEVQIETSFEEFMKWLEEEKQTFALDTGNIKLTYNSVSLSSVFKGLIFLHILSNYYLTFHLNPSQSIGFCLGLKVGCVHLCQVEGSTV